MVTEIDYMEYATNTTAQNTYISNGRGTQVLPSNPGFELWTAGDTSNPDGWQAFGAGIGVAKEATIKVEGSFSAKLTGGGDGQMYQDITTGGGGLAYWKGRTVSIGAWVYATSGKRAQVGVYDAASATNSPLHTGDSTWQWLEVSHTISASATVLYARMLLVDASSTVYFDDAVFVDAANVHSIFPYSVTTPKTQGSYSLKVLATTNGLNKTLTRTIA